MPKFRRKLSAVTRDFQTELKRLERFDAINQTMFSTSASVLSKHQLHFLTEAIFFRAFRAYEKFLGDIFLLYCLEKRPRSGAKVTAYLNPKSFAHAEKLIQGSQRFLDWLDPDTVISRAEVYSRIGRSDEALSDMTKCIELEPTNAINYYWRGFVYDNDKNLYEKARLDYTKAFELDPNYANAYFDNAVVCEKLGRDEEAYEMYKKYLVAAIDDNPRDTEQVEHAMEKIKELRGK